MIAITVSDVAGQLNETYHYHYKMVKQVLFWLASIGLGGFQANIVQFGLDQLPDASTMEITSFIVWYVSTIISQTYNTCVQILEFSFPEKNSRT